MLDSRLTVDFTYDMYPNRAEEAGKIILKNKYGVALPPESFPSKVYWWGPGKKKKIEDVYE